MGAGRVRRLRGLGGLGLALLTIAACGEAPPASPTRNVLIAVDGLEWNVVLPMLERGGLPALRALMERGRFGLLETIEPTLSPVIWTTVATSKPPRLHGIAHFAKQPGNRALYTNRDRRVKAIWNIASEHGRRVAVIGWWMTYPVEPVNGVMVAQTNTVEQIVTLRGKVPRKGGLVPGASHQVHPPELQDEVMERLEEAEAALPGLLAETFGGLPQPRTPLEERLWQGTLWSFRADAVYVALAAQLLTGSEAFERVAGSEGFDLLAVYVGAPDVVGHRFWRHRHPEAYAHPPDPGELERFGRVIEATYALVDRWIGTLVEAAGPEARVWVVSDHGMEAVRRGARFDPEDPPADLSSGHHRRALPGVIVAAGPDLVPGETPVAGLTRDALADGASVFDLTPTLLALMGVPVGDDMVGRPLQAWLDPAFLARSPVRRVASHESAEWLEAHRNLPAGDLGRDERIEQLRALGYLD